MLEALIAASPGYLSAGQLLEKAWDENADPFSKTVAVTIGRLRDKLGEPHGHRGGLQDRGLVPLSRLLLLSWGALNGARAGASAGQHGLAGYVSSKKVLLPEASPTRKSYLPRLRLTQVRRIHPQSRYITSLRPPEQGARHGGAGRQAAGALKDLSPKRCPHQTCFSFRAWTSPRALAFADAHSADGWAGPSREMLQGRVVR